MIHRGDEHARKFVRAFITGDYLQQDDLNCRTVLFYY